MSSVAQWKGAAKSAVVQEIARHRLETPLLQRLDHAGVMALHHHALVVDRQHVHAEPLAAHRGDLQHPVGDRVGLGRDQDLPGFQDRRQPVDIDVFRVDQHPPRPERHEGGVDMHRRAAAGLDLVDAVAAVGEVPAQPLDA
jgi:hypothetical protein